MAVNWSMVTAKLPADKKPQSKAKRDALFDSMDPNGNGYLSLAEVDRGIRDVLDLDSLFNCKPAIMLAFQTAKAAGKGTAELGPDYVERSEFRLFLAALRQYFELYSMFDRVDVGDDRRIDLGEFIKAVRLLQKWGVQVPDPTATFREIDVNGGGEILFNEFASWALSQGLDLEDDDN